MVIGSMLHPLSLYFEGNRRYSWTLDAGQLYNCTTGSSSLSYLYQGDSVVPSLWQLLRIPLFVSHPLISAPFPLIPLLRPL